ALGLGSDSAYRVIVLISGAAFLGAAAIIRTIPVARTGTYAATPRARRGYRLVMRNRPFLGLTLLNVPSAFRYMVLSVSLPVYVTQVLGTSTSLVGVLYAVNTVGIAVLQIPVTRVLVRYRRTRVAAVGFLMFAASFLFFAVLALSVKGSVLLIGVFTATA